MKELQRSIVLPAIEPVPSAMTLDEIRAAVKAAAEERHAASLKLSQLLLRVHDEKLYEPWQYASFGAYVKAELGLDIKHAESLVRVERVLIVEAGVGAGKVFKRESTETLCS